MHACINNNNWIKYSLLAKYWCYFNIIYLYCVDSSDTEVLSLSVRTLTTLTKKKKFKKIEKATGARMKTLKIQTFLWTIQQKESSATHRTTAQSPTKNNGSPTEKIALSENGSLNNNIKNEDTEAKKILF